MFEAQYLFGGNSVFSPWMGRSGDNLIINVDLIANSGSGVEVEIYQKNSEVAGDGAPYLDTGTSLPLKLLASTVNQHTQQGYNGVLELVRYKITASGSSTNRILFRMLANVWYDDVNATGS